MIADFERCYRAVQSKDPRFDGWFFVAVTSTGIYCRPSCPAVTPRREHVRFHASAAAAQSAGFRACKRCRPDATPGSPDWNLRADLTGRAMRLVADGVVDREGVAGLAARLGYSVRHVHRQLTAEVGAGPLALARAQRAQTARVLIETTGLPFTEIAFAAGFASIRQFNDVVRAVFAATPTQLRRQARHVAAGAADSISLRLAYREPCDVQASLAFLAVRAVPGLEAFDGGRYRRALSLPHGPGVVELSPAAGHVACVLHLADLRDLAAAVQRCRRLLDLDADPVAVAGVLGADPAIGPLAQAAPGRRVPATPDGPELVMRAVLGQHVSVAAARTLAGRLVATLGKPLTRPQGTVTHTFPTPAALAAAEPGSLPLPARRGRTLAHLAALLADDVLAVDPGVDRDEVSARLRAVPGVGPWTVGYVRMRALGDPDGFLPSDLGVRRALERLGHQADPRAAERLSHRWRPWRAYAVQQLWALPDYARPARPAADERATR